MSPFCHKKSGTTLLEIVVVISIVSIFAGIAMPKFFDLIERFRAEEGKQLLNSIYAAQKRCYIETQTYATALNWSALDIEPRPSKYFTVIVLYQPYPFLGVIRRTESGTILYDLMITDQGKIYCLDNHSGSFSGACDRIGIPRVPP